MKRYLTQDGSFDIGLQDTIQFQTGFNIFESKTDIGAAISGNSDLLSFAIGGSEFMKTMGLGILLSALI